MAVIAERLDRELARFSIRLLDFEISRSGNHDSKAEGNTGKE